VSDNESNLLGLIEDLIVLDIFTSPWVTPSTGHLFHILTIALTFRFIIMRPLRYRPIALAVACLLATTKAEVWEIDTKSCKGDEITLVRDGINGAFNMAEKASAFAQKAIDNAGNDESNYARQVVDWLFGTTPYGDPNGAQTSPHQKAKNVFDSILPFREEGPIRPGNADIVSYARILLGQTIRAHH
jgi:hypothetical protein